MIEVRFHGRGGQGAVTAARLLAVAAFKEGKYVQSFPMFGIERRGAPVMAFLRMDDKQIRIRSQVYEPDAIVVLDDKLIKAVNVCEGLKSGGMGVINTKRKPSEIGFKDIKMATVDATSIAVKHGLGSKAAPIVNTAILGAYARAAEEFGVGKIGIDSIVKAIMESVPSKPNENADVAKEAYEKSIFA